jgi:hypothetical protein
LKPNGFDSTTPVHDKENSDLTNLEEYGYGLWARFLVYYPVRMPNGKNQPWYFLARLTSNNPYDNIRMGDRLLAIWQGANYYHLTTCDVPKG